MNKIERGSKPTVKILFLLLSFTLLTVLFQNCGQSFTVDPAAFSTSSQSSITPGTPAVPAKPGVSYAEFKECRATAEATLATCLDSKSPVKGALSATTFNTCYTASTAELDLGACLTKNGFTIAGYREPIQKDFENCAAAVGTQKIQACLDKNGVLTLGIDQAGIESCIGAVGIGGVEVCLRNRNLLKRLGTVSNYDIAVCKKVYGDPISDINLRSCLTNKELIPATLTDANLAQCQMAAPTATAKCLRTNRFVPRFFGQAQISRCIGAVGVAASANCLDANGYLYDKLLPVATLQTQIDTCNTNVGPANIAKCLRTNNFLEKLVMQGPITACGQVAGPANVVTCLTANGLLTNGVALNSPAGTIITQADIDDCVAKGSPATVSTCLVTKKLLNAKPVQDNHELCHRLAGPTGIAACLDSSGMLPVGVTQANFDTCLAAAGLAGLETCMATRGFIP